MAADFKSHVLRRDEKGFLGIPFKRWLLAGVVGGMCFAMGGVVLGTLNIPVAILLTVVLLVLTGERAGLPRWQSLLLRGRGRLILAAAANPAGLAAQLAHAFEIDTTSVFAVEGDTLFAPAEVSTVSDYVDWLTSLDATHDDDLVFLDTVLEVEA